MNGGNPNSRMLVLIIMQLWVSLKLKTETSPGSSRLLDPPGNPWGPPGWCLMCLSRPGGEREWSKAAVRATSVTFTKTTPEWAPWKPLTLFFLPACPSYLFPELSSDVAQPLGSVEAHGLQTAVPQHLNHLSVLCARGGKTDPLVRHPDLQKQQLGGKGSLTLSLKSNHKQVITGTGTRHGVFKLALFL